ncbi:MAG: Mpo1-like protein [Bdellovibrionota bacterium]
MKTLNDWLLAYGETHQNKTNRTIHLICVPLILFSVVGMLWCIPKGFLFPDIKYVNWSHIVTIFALIFYARLGLKPFLLMLSTFIAVNIVLMFLDSNTTQLLTLNIIIFVLAWIGQFYGHHIEGKKPKFYQDLQFLLIGPLWVYYH